MKVESWLAIGIGAFFGATAPVYWYMSEDPTGTSALVMASLLGLLMGFFLAVVAKQIPHRPEDRHDAEIVEGAGEQGFFPPFSWWPLFTASAIAVAVVGVAIGWWLFIIGAGIGFMCLTGFVFEYYRGYHAH